MLLNLPHGMGFKNTSKKDITEWKSDVWPATRKEQS